MDTPKTAAQRADDRWAEFGAAGPPDPTPWPLHDPAAEAIAKAMTRRMEDDGWYSQHALTTRDIAQKDESNR